MPDEHDPLRDPLDLDAVDREIRINELRERVSDLGASAYHVSDDCPPELEEEFLGGIAAFEAAPLSTKFDRLTRAGVELPPPETMDDESLTAKLWEVIDALAAMDSYLSRTDHLSDRELYTALWSDTLRDVTPELPVGSGWRNHIDILGGCSEEDIQISLRYYDTEKERQRWAEEFPGDTIPPHEDPPYDRDRRLPTPPEPELESEPGEWDEDD